jgi:heat shock protein HspQ
MQFLYIREILWVYVFDIDTDFAEKKKKQDEIQRKKKQELKKHILVQLRHHTDMEYDEDSILNDDNDDILKQEEPSIFSIFFTFHGICIIASFVVFLFLNYLLDTNTSVKVKSKTE